MSQNFEELYNKLKEEYESSKKDNDEICKEYESTIEMLSESVEGFKKEKEALQQKLSKLEQEQKNFKKEKESLMNKNKDKITDIQNLSKQNERLTVEISRLKEEKSLYDSKIVNLENDNEHYQNKLREFEVYAEDLEGQLESALEENITLQTEYETLKQTTGDQLIRKDDEIRDIKNDLLNKEKFIQRLQRGNDALLVKNIKKNINEGVDTTVRRRFTLVGNKNNLLAFQKTLESTGIVGNNEEKTEKKEDSNAIKECKTNTFGLANVANRYKARNSFLVPGRYNALVKLAKQREELNKGLIDNGNQYPLQSKNSLVSNISFLSDKKIAEEKIDEKSEKSEISDNEKDKDFKGLKISKNINFNYAGVVSIKATTTVSNGAEMRILGNERKIMDNLQKLLERIRKRKEKLIGKKNIKQKKKKEKK
jgi:hypothetical protein